MSSLENNGRSSAEAPSRSEARFSWPTGETIFAYLLERTVLGAAEFDGFSAAADECDRLVLPKKRDYFARNRSESRPSGGWNRFQRLFYRFFSAPAAPEDDSDTDAAEPVSKGPPPLQAFLPVGAFRRREEALEELTLIAATDSSDALFDRLEADLPTAAPMEREGDRLTLFLSSLPLRLGRLGGVKLTVLTVPAGSFYSAALFETASPDDWAALTAAASRNRLRLERFGLFAGDKPVPLDSTEAIYERLGLRPQPPELLGSGTSFRSLGEKPYRLLDESDIRGDLHTHTSYSDGSGSIEEMASAAIERRLDYIALTDHSERCYVAGGMDASRFRSYWKKIDRLNQRIAASGGGFRILKGAEVDILPDGSLDLHDDDLARADWVVASVHFELRQDRPTLHRRIERALSNPYVCVLAHPTQRSFESDFCLDVDPEFLVDCARRYGKFLELNAQPRRLDLDARLCRLAKERSVKIVISTDAHAPDQLENLRYGINVARRAGLTRRDVLNTLSTDELLAERGAILERREWELFGKGDL